MDNDGGGAKIGEIKASTNIKDYSIDAVLDYQEKIIALNESYAAGGMKKISGEHMLGLYNLLTGFLGNAWGSFDVSMSLKDVSLTRPPIPGSPAGKLKIGNAALGFNMSGFQTGAIKLGTSFSYNDFQLAPLSEENRRTVPDHASLDLSINNLPYKDIVDLGRQSIQTSIDSPKSASAAGINAVMMLPQLLTKSQTNLALKNGNVGNDEYNIKLDATMIANLKAALSATGNAKAEIFGFDNLINDLNAAAKNPEIDAKDKQRIQQTLGVLSVLKMAGQMGKDGKGRDVRTYDFQLNEQGQALLNGSDLQMIMQSVQGTKQP